MCLSQRGAGEKNMTLILTEVTILQYHKFNSNTMLGVTIHCLWACGFFFLSLSLSLYSAIFMQVNPPLTKIKKEK